MSRKNMSQDERIIILENKMNEHDKLEKEINHLMSENWRDSYPKEEY